MSEMPEGWSYNKERQEIICPHGVGHYAPWSNRDTHGCDGCCVISPGDEEDNWAEALRTARKIHKSGGR